MKRVVGLLVLCGVFVSGCSLISSDDSGESADEEPNLATLVEAVDQCMAAPAPGEPALVTVWLEPQMGPESEADAVQAVDTLLAATNGVVDYTFIGSDETFARFQEYFADEPEVLELVAPDQLPLSFEVQLADDAAADAVTSAAKDVAGVSGVETVVDPAQCSNEIVALAASCSANTETTEGIVWLDVGINARETAAVEQVLATHPLVTRVEYIGPEETLAEFQENFAQQPELLDLVDAEQLPTSFTFTTEAISTDGIEALRREIDVAAKGIDRVELLGTASAACRDLPELS